MISIIIPWCNRAELKEALPSIIANAKQVNGNVTIVNLLGDIQFLLKLISNYINEITIINIHNFSKFNKSLAQNIGAKNTTSPYLFFCDCDIILPHGILKYLLDKMLKKYPAFVTFQQVQETRINSRLAKNLISINHKLTLKTKKGVVVEISDNEEDAITGKRSAPGLLMVKREDFEKVEGYNSNLNGWGWEDNDIICRLVLYANLSHICLGEAIHISHDDIVRMQAYSEYKNRWENKDQMLRQVLSNYDNNLFLGTYLTDTKEFLIKTNNHYDVIHD